MIDKTPSSELLRRYLSHACNDSERRVVDEWYLSLNLQSEENFTGQDEDRLLTEIQTQIAQAEQPFHKIHRPETNWWIYAGGIAAILILSIGFLFYHPASRDLSDAVGSHSERPVRMTNNQKKALRYTLPDESIVWLQPGASIEHPESFSEKPVREVSFEGEGFFDVAKDHEHPFIIHSGRLQTEVVGTSFNVKANPADQTYQVSVVTGSVSVSASARGEKVKSVLLKPRQQAVFVITTNDLTMSNLEDRKTNIEIWQPVSLNFEDVALADIVGRLQKTFRVKIDIANPVMKSCVLKVDFDHQNLPEILEMVNALLGSTYEIDGQHITLSGEGCGGQ